MATTRKQQVSELVAQGRHLEARMLILRAPEAYMRGDAPEAGAAPAAPVAAGGPATAPPPPPPQSVTPQAFRAEVERLNALGGNGAGVLAARALLLTNPTAYIDGRPSNPPAAPVAPITETPK